MKNFKFKWLLLSIVLSIASINQVWAWSGIRLRSEQWTGGWSYTSDTWTYGGEAQKYWDLYHSGGDAYWRIHLDYFNHDAGPSSDKQVQNVGTAGYKVSNQSTNSFKTTANAGVLRICSNQNSGGDETPYVWVERPAVKFKYPWDGSSWEEREATDNQDGTYTRRDTYRGTNYFNAKPVNGASKVAKTTTTVTGSPNSGDRCEFKWTASGYKYTGGEEDNRGVFVITKLVNISYDSNSSSSGTAPSTQEVLYDVSSTLATKGDLTKTDYVFTGWNTKSDGSGTHYDAGGSITITANTTLYAEWNRKWAIQGSGTEMGAWAKYNDLSPTGTANEFSGTIELAANTTYVFKLRNREDNSLWGYGDSDYQLAFVGQSGAYNWDLESTSGKQNLVLMSAKAGTYTFTYNCNTTKRLTVGFPEQSHPNTDNIYFKNSGGSPYASVNIHLWGGSGSTGYYRLPTLPTCTFAGETYYYAARGNSTKCLFASGEINPSTKTSDQEEISEKVGKYYDLATETWKTFDVTVTLDNQSATTAGQASVTATYNVAMPSIAANLPEKTGYIFHGYFASTGGSGTKYYNADGTSAHVWDQTGASPRIYAHWTPITYTVAYYSNDASYPGTATGETTSSSHTYDVAKNLTSNGFGLNGYSFAGWGTDAGTSAATYTDGQSVSNLSSTQGATVNLYARWTEDTHEVTLANDGHGHVEISDSEVTEVSGIGITTASSAITAVPNEGYHFDNWTGDIGDGVTIASGSTTSATITINATADSKTITANFAGNEYTVTFDQEGGEGGSANVTATFGSDMPVITLPHKIGYAFDGYWDGDNGTGNQYYNANGTSACTWNKTSATTLYAKWVPDNNTFTNAKKNGDWSDAGNWSAGVVPTNSYAAVQLSGELNVSSYIHVGSMDLTASGAKLTIQAGGTLEVAGAITNTNPDKLVIQTGNEGQGALIYDITKTAPYATISMTTKNAAGAHYQYIASPVGGVSVADVFSGKGAYTYVWKEGIGWERRGYYDDIAAFEPIALKGKGSCSFVGQLYPGTTSLSLSYTGTPTNADAQGVNMLANALTAPIKIAAMTISGSSDGSVHVWNDGIWDHSAVASAVEDVIPAMQVYAILASSSGSVSFDYETAVRGASDKNAALKAPKRIASDIPEHITISVRTNERDIDLQLYEDEMFTNEIDKGWEAIYMEGDGRFGELYAQADEKMSILATPDLEGTILGFAPGETSDYTISFNGDGKGYYLNDMKELKSTLISEGSTYMFSPDESTNATRFVISRTPIHKVPTGTENVSAGTNARKQMINGTLYIIRDGRIYNAEGALVK